MPQRGGSVKHDAEQKKPSTKGCLHETSRTGKATDTESRWVVAEGGWSLEERGKWCELILDDQESDDAEESALTDDGDGCSTQ